MIFPVLPLPHSPQMVAFILKTIGRLPVGNFFIYQIILLFIIYSIAGWILETIYRSWNAKKLVNPGVLTGPLVPLYGVGGLTIIAVCTCMSQYDMAVRAFAYFLILSVVEYLTGEMLLLFFNRRFWDYRDCRFNIRGHVCLRFSAAWVILAFVFEKTIFPGSLMFLQHVPEKTAYIINVFAVVIIMSDLTFTYGLEPVRNVRKNALMSVYQRIQSVIQIDHSNASLALRRPISSLIERRREVRRTKSGEDDSPEA